MLTDAELKLGFYERFKRPLDEENLQGLKRFIRNFELENYNDFQEMYDAMLISMHSISEEIEQTTNVDKAREILRKRYAKL